MFFSMARLALTAAALLLPICVQAVAFTDDSFDGIAVGKPMNLTWSGDKTPVTIKLMQGRPEALEPVVTIASNIAGESYIWTPKTIASGTYVLSIIQGSNTNYSPQFPVANTPPPGAPANNPPPGAAGTKPPIKAPVVTAPPGATGPVLPSAVIVAYHPPAGHYDDSRTICGYEAAGGSTTAYVPCPTPWASQWISAAGIEKRNAAIGAAVVGMTFAIIMVL